MAEVMIAEVKVGDKISSVILTEGLPDFQAEKYDIAELIRGKKVVIFGVPGAFTPGCSKSHLPSFMDAQGDLKAKGVDMTICIATNDPYVMGVSIG
jgi:2-Cys peroxiredoxin 5